MVDISLHTDLARPLPLTPPDIPMEGKVQLPTVAVVGLGYVGLPVAVAFGKHRHTIGYDLSTKKISRLRQGIDTTGEISTEQLHEAEQLDVTDDASQIRAADFVIVAVPTPVNAARQPDFGPLESASRIVG